MGQRNDGAMLKASLRRAPSTSALDMTDRDFLTTAALPSRDEGFEVRDIGWDQWRYLEVCRDRFVLDPDRGHGHLERIETWRIQCDRIEDGSPVPSSWGTNAGLAMPCPEAFQRSR